MSVNEHSGPRVEVTTYADGRPAILIHLPGGSAGYPIEECGGAEVLRRFAAEPALAVALGELVRLQAHYAALLNGYDGGKRVSFVSAQAWLDRLADLRKIPATTIQTGC